MENNMNALLHQQVSDSEVITRVLQGEKDLFALLIRRYNQRLYRVAIAILQDEREAEDAMQVAYIKAYENLKSFESRSSFSTWLTRILVNESLLRIRKSKHSIFTKDHAVITESNLDHPMETQTPVIKLLHSELKMKLEEAIQRLPEKYRTVFVLREMENLSVAETQECLALSEANVKTRLNRAKVLLRESLSSYYKNEDLFHLHLSRCDRIVEQVMKEIDAK